MGGTSHTLRLNRACDDSSFFSSSDFDDEERDTSLDETVELEKMPEEEVITPVTSPMRHPS